MTLIQLLTVFYVGFFAGYVICGLLSNSVDHSEVNSK